MTVLPDMPSARQLEPEELDRKVLRAIAMKGRACTLDEVADALGLDVKELPASVARLSERTLVAPPARGATTWEATDRKDEPADVKAAR